MSGEEFLEQYGPQTVAGKPVTHYWSSNESAGGKTTWSTSHTCKRLRAEVGLDDRSDAGADAQFRVGAGSQLIVDLRVTKGTSTPIDVPIARATSATVRFSAVANNALTPTYVNASNPRTLRVPRGRLTPLPYECRRVVLPPAFAGQARSVAPSRCGGDGRFARGTDVVLGERPVRRTQTQRERQRLLARRAPGRRCRRRTGGRTR